MLETISDESFIPCRSQKSFDSLNLAWCLRFVHQSFGLPGLDSTVMKSHKSRFEVVQVPAVALWSFSQRPTTLCDYLVRRPWVSIEFRATSLVAWNDTITDPGSYRMLDRHHHMWAFSNVALVFPDVQFTTEEGSRISKADDHLVVGSCLAAVRTVLEHVSRMF